ncbi:Zn-dependent protease with chaperone function [Candidatus Electrothrix aarhusensis]|uniref:Zn-dependent protease with chaperone function n=1 Tax=Candidatus Electrothrix aarhusensis TaxID=1859131 RepID=A0A3S3SIJ1_9BACT|nr:Zn-dependent protease with chaperone function [Candidatus Electrothrix aarhusensis]
MIYNNLIYFLAVIFVISTATTPEQPWLPPWLALPLFALLLLAFSFLAGKLFGSHRFISSQRYFSAEKKASFLATVLFIVSFFIFDLKYYAQPLSFNNTLPVLANLFGLVLFFCFLTLVWLRALPSYRRLFNSFVSPTNFVLNNIGTNLTIVLPWLILSFFLDLLNILPLSGMENWLGAPWGELFIFLFFFLLLALLFPPVIRRLWRCVPMEPGPLRHDIERFCHSQNFSSEILYWPLFEGKMVTAGVMGMVPKFRYLLLTPALLSTLDQEELESVIAHEIGHVKKYHMILYLFLFLGFSLLAEAMSGPLHLLMLNNDWFYRFLIWSQISGDTLLISLAAAIVFLLMLLYFRFVFGYFIRNFERQADLYVFKAQKTAFPLIRSFEKIAAMSGSIRHKKNWHHFGIGERIAFLEKCEHNQKIIRLHDWKVYCSLAVYVFLIGAGSWSLHHLDTEHLYDSSQTHSAKVAFEVLEEKMQQEPENSKWLKLFGDLMLERGKESAALQAYKKALRSLPISSELANNMAWLLLTAKDRSLRDPVRALNLARSAAQFSEQGYVLDTLATALWANGKVQEAVAAERKAAELDRDGLAYYQSRMDTFRQESWGQEE